MLIIQIIWNNINVSFKMLTIQIIWNNINISFNI